MLKHLGYERAATDVRALADDLAAGHRAGEREAGRRLASHHPRFTGLTAQAALRQPVQAADAELAVAREHGFATWRQMLAFVRHGEGLADFLQLACLCYFQTDRPANREQARAMLAADPALARRDIWHAACVGDAAAVAGFLDADPALVEKLGGHFDWPPLLYACYSRLDLPGRSTLAAARLLIARGADPNAHYMWGGQYRFTALAGAFGEGEMGPVNQPPHEERDALAKLLLAAGADPNDGQALYNTMFTPASGCLETLLAHGLGATHRNNWLLEENGRLVENPERTLDYQLRWAVRKHHPARAKLLVEHGADVTIDDGSLHEAAMLSGQPDLAAHLAEHGAPTARLSPVQRFVAACNAADGDGARALLASDPDIVRRTGRAMPKALAAAAQAGRLAAVRLMLELGFDPNRPRTTALHEAAFHGHAAVVDLLLREGANIRARDDHFAATPLQWALTAGEQEVAAVLGAANIGIFDAVLVENLPRIAAVLDAAPASLEITIGEERPGADAHQDDWQTPLAFAALRNRAGALKLLLERGARLDVAHPDGSRLPALARAAGADATAGLLDAAASEGRGV